MYVTEELENDLEIESEETEREYDDVPFYDAGTQKRYEMWKDGEL